ncbi:MAG: hypothetical protein PHX92_02290, partial [Candidatus Pacebacteria bacterium]|nr:hypothetical protein [Candidatus Paceibacterota bacterium]
NNCNLIDEVLAEPSWPAGDNDTKKTMERGSDLSWHTYFGEFLGTPKAENSIQEEIIDDVIEEDNINDFLVISEIQTNGIDGLEYVELFNQSDEEIELCNEESCYYLAYFSTSKDEEGNYNYDWNNPYYKWDFPLGETIPPKSYYLILVHGNIESDFIVLKQDGLPYSSQLLGNSDGSVGVFLNELAEEDLTVELARQLKVDVVGWGDNDFPVKEEKSLVIGNNNESFGRKLDGVKYRDTDNNFNDFELQEQSPGAKAKFPPQKIEDIQITGLSNSITLTWATPEDDDSLPEDINYEVRFSLISEGDFNVLDDANIENIDGLNVLELDNLYYDKDYYFIIQAIDSDNNKSEFSDKVSFKTFPSHHKISSIYSKSNFSNSINNFLSEDIIMENNLEIMSSPLLIDENDKIYFSARKSGARHIFSMEGNEIMWSYKCEKFCNIMSLGEDGTIYLHDSYSIKALSPKGELKWKKDGLGEISGGTFTIDSSGKIYFVANLSGNYKIYSIEDKFSEPLSNIVYSFAPKENLQSLTIDSNDNLYFSIINRLIKINLPSNAISEKIIDVDYHEEYSEEKDKITRIKKIKITPDDKILISVDHQYFNKDNKEYDSLILFSEGVNNILWKKISNGNIINIDNNQIYLWQNDSISDTAFMTFCLYGLNIEDGSVLWRKKWVSNISMSHINQLETDNNGNVYFNKGTFFMGYNTNNITSEKPEDDLILNEPLKANIYSFSIIDSKVFFSLPLKIVLKNY